LAMNDFTRTPQKGQKWPLELVWCPKCHLLQLAHNFPLYELYKKFYWYRSGLNPVIVEDLKNIVKSALKFRKQGLWCDVGANDGTLLSFVPKSFKRVGIEPARNLFAELKKNCDSVQTCFWEEYGGGLMFDVISAIGMFYDSVDPNEFIKKVTNHLTLNGIFIAQLMTLEPMLKYNDVGNICHEHIEYYTYKSLVQLYEQNGLEIFKVEKNRINGGSYRLYARHYRRGSVRIRENITPQKVKTFFKKIEENKKETVAFIQKETRKGKVIWGYGASTKGNTILQYYGLHRGLLRAIADKNEEKWGKYTIGSRVPIRSEEEGRKEADYFFILPWGFTKYFLQREKKWRKGGGKFIVSIPNFRVYGSSQD